MMESEPNCVQCGGTEYILLDGFYFCTECNIQSQDMQERVFETYFSQTTAKAVAPEDVQQNVQKAVDHKKHDKTHDLTSFEVLNHILKGLVDEMIQLGANKKLKIVVFQLWCMYLKKIEAAFLSTTYEANPRLGFLFKRRDAELLYGMDYEETQYHRFPLRKRKPPKKRRRSLSSMTSTSQRSERLRLTRQKKQLAKAEYKDSQLETTQMAQTLESLEVESQSSKGSSKISFSKQSKAILNEFVNQAITSEESDVKKIIKRAYINAGNSAQNPTVGKLVPFLTIACAIVGEHVHISDLVKWIEEGYVSIRNAEKHLPSRSTLVKDIRTMYSTSMGCYTGVHEDLTSISRFLGIQCHQSIIPYIKRYIKEFCLPTDLEIVINKLINIKKIKLKYEIQEKIEGIALAFILMAIKLLFVLDEVSEYELSDFADKINKDPEAVMEEGEQFSFIDWTKYITARTAHLSKIHYPTNHRQYRGSYNGGSAAFLSQWDNAKITYSIKRYNTMKDNEKNTLNIVLKDLVAPLEEPRFKPAQFPSLTPMFSNYKAMKGPDYNKNSLSFLIKEEFREKMMKKHNIREFHSIKGIYEVLKGCRKSETTRYRFHPNSSEELIQLIVSEDQGDKRAKEKPNHLREFIYESDSDDESTIRVPGGQYWMYYSSWLSLISIEQFQSTFAQILPSNFFWLLTEFSNVTRLPKHIIFFELQKLEHYVFSDYL